MIKTILSLAFLASTLFATSASAAIIPDKPSITASNITGTTAAIDANLGFINRPVSTSFSYQYIEAHKICPMIYPPIPECVPKKVTASTSPVTITGLVPGKTYDLSLVEKHQVQCLMAPCDDVENIIATTTFTTTSKTAAIVLALDIPKVGTSTATVSLNDAAKSGLSADELKRIYFTYQEVNIICKKDCSIQTLKGTSAMLTNLKPGTLYKVRAVKDSSIQCIKAPCPTDITYGDEFTFTTAGLNDTNTSITHILRMGSRGDEARTLQEFLIAKGFMSGTASGYFGNVTLKSLKAFQKSVGLSPTGSTGVKTRAIINGGK